MIAASTAATTPSTRVPCRVLKSLLDVMFSTCFLLTLLLDPFVQA